MEGNTNALQEEKQELRFDLGTFEGFNFRDQSAMWPNRTADEVVNWDHDKNGEAEFWPSGDNEGVHLVFKGSSSVTSAELIALDELMAELGGDSEVNFLRIHYAISTCGARLEELSGSQIEDQNVQFFFGDCFTDARKEAAYELFELYYPEEYQVWEKSQCDGLVFDTDRFLDAPGFSVEEIRFDGKAVLLVVPQ
jgi:hypothetical protein